MKPSAFVNINIAGVTPTQYEAIIKLLAGEAEDAPRKRGRKAKPKQTVNEEEEEDFGSKSLGENDLNEEEDKETEEEGETEEEEETEEGGETEEEPIVSFEDLRAAVNKYGEKYPDQMRAILAGFKIKGPKDLAATHNQKHWDGVYQKVIAQLKAAKKAK